MTILHSLKGQCDIRMYDIHTPMGSEVVTFLMCEESTYTREYYDNYYSSRYPNAEKIIVYDGLSSTRKFNCHGYAWLRVEQGIDRWIGTGWSDDIIDPESIYMTDGSYTQVSIETYPGKVSWASGDHSAITTNQQGWFVSKWNQYPLFKHRWNDSPYGTSNLKYYIKNCTLSYTNRIVLTNTTIIGCTDLNVQNVTVTNNAKLKFNASGEVTINGLFEVALGSELEIK